MDNSKVIVCFEKNSEQDGKIGRYQWDKARKMCKILGLSPVTMRNMQFGGGTNATFILGFGVLWTLPTSRKLSQIFSVLCSII